MGVFIIISICGFLTAIFFGRKLYLSDLDNEAKAFRMSNVLIDSIITDVKSNDFYKANKKVEELKLICKKRKWDESKEHKMFESMLFYEELVNHKMYNLKMESVLNEIIENDR